MRMLQMLTLSVVYSFLIACEYTPKPQSTKALNDTVVNESHRFDQLSVDPIAHGERLVAVLGCIGCHKPDLTGEDWSDPELGVLWTANLTHSAAEFSNEELAVMITEGKRPDRVLIDMPSFLFTNIHPQDLTALVSYLKSLPVKGNKHPNPTIGPKLAEDIASGEFKNAAQQVDEKLSQSPVDLGEQHSFARFILRATCVECHGMDLDGNAEVLSDAPPRPSLRIIAAYSLEDFKNLMRTGKALGNRDLKMMSGVARWRYSQLTDREIEAIYNYLIKFSHH